MTSTRRAPEGSRSWGGQAGQDARRLHWWSAAISVVNVPLLKHVAALPGQEICRVGRSVTVDAVPFGDALDHDHLGRDLRFWRAAAVALRTAISFS